MKKQKIALLCGGKSAERLISVKSAMYIANYLDRKKYELFFVNYSVENKLNDFDTTFYEFQKILSQKNYLFNDADIVSDNFIDYLSDAAKKSNELTEINQLKQDKIDFVFPVFHGLCGEDAIIQGVLEFNDIPYAGCGVSASCVANDKERVKKISKSSGIPVADYILVRKNDFYASQDIIIDKIITDFSLPVFVKPPNLGSSVGIHKCYTKEKLIDGIKDALSYGNKVIIEKPFIGNEYGISVAGLEKLDNSIKPLFSVPALFQCSRDFLDYDAKYGVEALPDIIPAPIDEKLKDILYKYAQIVYEEFELSGMSRIDFFADNDYNVILNEINTVPGFGAYSVFNNSWIKSGYKITDIITNIITTGFKRYEDKNKYKFTIL